MGRQQKRSTSRPRSTATMTTARTSASRSIVSSYANASSNSSAATSQSNKSARCCTIPVCLSVFLIAAAVGGVILWKMLPGSSKSQLQNSIGNTLRKNYTNGGLPLEPGSGPLPKDFKWNQLCTNSSNQNRAVQANDDDNAYQGGNDDGTNSTSSDYDCCNGVSGLCDLKPSDILFASLHNGQATVENGWYFAGNHDWSLEDALVAGYRGVNVDVGMCDGQVQMIHGMCKLGTRDPFEVFTNVANFLLANPHEVLIIPIEIVTEEDATELVTLDGIQATMPQEFLDLMYSHTPGEEWPTLRQLIDQSKRILLFHYGGPSCSMVTCPPGFHEWFYYAVETEFEFESVDAVNCELQRGTNGVEDFLALNDFVTNPLPDKMAAETLNSFDYLQNHLSSCAAADGQNPNLVFVDFWDQGDVVEVTQRHNYQLVQTRRQRRMQVTQQELNGQIEADVQKRQESQILASSRLPRQTHVRQR